MVAMAEWSSNVERFEVQTRKKIIIRSGELSINYLFVETKLGFRGKFFKPTFQTSQLRIQCCLTRYARPMSVVSKK